jgi:MFS transporter, MHS family, shikimate and dehydroshikimate transport protein
MATASSAALNGHAQKSADKRVLAASSVGTILEWYDFFLYGTAAALVFDKLFFSSSLSDTAATLASFATFGAGFFARPFGAVLFGHFGDRVGRRNMLIISLTMMGLASAAIGCLPTYATIGLLAPILLVLLRLVQGFGVGGEWGGAVLMVTEHAPDGKRGRYGAFVQMGVPAGLLLATCTFLLIDALTTEAQFMAWGWRIPFLASIVLVAVGLFIRLKVLESPDFQEAKAKGKTEKAPAPIVETVKNHPRELATAFGARVGENALFYLFTVFILEYGESELGFERNQLLVAVIVAACIGLFTNLFFGNLSDRVGRKPVYLFGATLSLVFSFFYIPMLDTESMVLIVLATVIGLNLGHDAQYGVQAAFFAESFGTTSRYTGAGMGYHLAAVFGGGIAPLVATALLATGENGKLLVGCYMALMCLITVVSVILARETKDRDFHEAPVDVEREGRFTRDTARARVTERAAR